MKIETLVELHAARLTPVVARMQPARHSPRQKDTSGALS